MSLVRGSITGISKKHRINSKISMEAELIGADYAKPQILWNQYCIKVQGLTIDERVLFQEKLSTILLDFNRMASSSNWKKHIRVWYYFIKDQISTGYRVVKHCPTMKC